MTSRALPSAPVGRAIPSPFVVALAGSVALAVAMGIGRFAFTPLLPMMLADDVIGLHAASWLATANYLGYLAGAVLCALQPWLRGRVPRWPALDARRMVRAGLAATAILTLAMALPWAPAWPLLRFAAGVASAFVFVHGSGWCLAMLAERGATALGGVMYTGPGAGIVLSGLLASAMVAWRWPAAAGWLTFGVLALGLTATVWRVFGGRSSRMPPEGRAAPAAMDAAQSSLVSARAEVAASNASVGEAPHADAHRGLGPATAAALNRYGAEALHARAEIGWLTFAYGLAGFGYIITATFLPVIAREALPGSAWLDFFWPIFGCGVVAGALLSTRLQSSGDLRRLLAGGYLIQAAAVAATTWQPTLAGFAFGSLLLGLPFTAITFFAMQEARRIRPLQAPSLMGLLTAAYGIGQIAGPPLVALLLQRSASAGAGFTRALAIAAGALLLGATIHLGMARTYPRADAAAA